MTIGRRSIDQLVKLTADILKQHGQLGSASPLNGQIDVVALAELLHQADTQRQAAVKATAAKEALNEQANGIIGVAKGQTRQTENTLRWHVDQVCRFMKFKFKGNEEQATPWGFRVTTGSTKGRRDVRFHVPRGSAPKLTELSEAIVKKYVQEGAASILTAPLFNMPAMQASLAEVLSLRASAKQNADAAQAANERARNLCGFGKGQTAQTPHTLYHNIIRIRDLLLMVHQGNEQQLEVWGFKVRVR